MCTLELLV